MRTLKEALITKNTIKNVMKSQYYIIFPWGSHEQFLCKNAREYDVKNIFHDGWTIFVMTESELENTYNKKISLILQSFNDSSDVKYWVSNLSKNEIIDIIEETITANVKKTYEILDKKFEKCK